MGSCVAYVNKSASPSIAASDAAKQNVSQAFAEEAKVAPSLLLRGLRPLGRQHTTLPCHPLLREGDNSPHAPSPVGVQCTRHQENSAGPKPQTLPNFLGAGRGI